MNKHSHNKASNRPLGQLHQRRLALSMALALGSLSLGGGALAAVPAVAAGSVPTGGVVVGGNGTITQSGLNTVINQKSHLLALDWQSFNVGKDATVQFNQPSFNAVALNRILDQNPSQIFGRINSNGQVFLINTHGIIFSPGAQLNVGGLMASTLDLTPSDFLANRFNLDAHGGSAGVVNHGTIIAASGGSVSLIGGKVVNDGLIVADYGRINLDGADRAVLDFDGSGLIKVQITGELKQRLDAGEAVVQNKGRLQAESGSVVLEAAAAKDLFTNLVNNSGVIDAGGISTEGGVVRLVGRGGDVINHGDIDASGVRGGSVQLLSDRNVGVTGGSIDASGALGGGSIRVGGGWQGGEGLPTARAVYIAPDATLKADATRQGNGGSVVVWGNQANNFYGDISARGGAYGGDGGRVETSAHDGLNAQGRVDASAPAGRAGSWLLDPHNVTLQASGTGTLDGTTPDKYFEASADDSTISTNTIENALYSGTNVSIFTGTSGTQNGDITVADAISAPGQGALYLKAAGSIFVDSNISGTSGSGPLNLYLWANYGGAATDLSYTSRADCTLCTVQVGRNAGNININIARGVLDVRTGDANHAGGLVQFGNGTAGSTGAIHAGAFAIHATGIDMGWGHYLFDVLDTTLAAGAGNVSLLDTTGGSGLSFGGDLVVSGNQIDLGSSSATVTIKAKSQSYDGTVTLGANTTLIATDTAKAVSLAGNLVGAGKSLAITGNAKLGAASGLSTLTVSNTATLNGDVSTAGTQTYGGAVLLGGPVTLTTTNSAIQFASTIDNAASATPGALTVNPGSGLVSFGGALGGGANGALGDLSLNGSNPVSLGAVNAASLQIGGDATLNGNVTTSGTQTYKGAVLLGGNTVLTTTNSAVDFAGTVDNASATVADLTVNAGTGTLSFGGAVGKGSNGAIGNLALNGSGATSLGVVDASSLVTGTGTTTLGGNISTSGLQRYRGAVLLGSDVSLSSSLGDVAFAGTLDNASSAAAKSLTVNANSGLVRFDDVVGGANGGLTSLTTSSKSFGAQALNIVGNLSVTANGGDITQGGAFSVGGSSQFHASGALTLDNSGNDFDGAVTASGAGVSIVDKNNLIVTGVTDSSNGAVNLVAGDVLTLPLGGINAGTGALTLVSGNGVLTTSGALTGGAVSLIGSQGITLGGDVTATTLQLGSTNAAITQTAGILNVSSTSNVHAGSGAITLTQVANSFGAAVSLTGGTTQIGALGSLSLGALATGNLTAVAGGALALAGDGTVNGLLSAQAVGAITVDGALSGLTGAAFAGTGLSGSGSLAGAGAVTGLGSTAFQLTGNKAGTAGGVGFSGFGTSDTTTVSGVTGFDDAAKTSGGMIFANATQVSGSGGITSVAGSFAEGTGPGAGTSAASGISYSGFDAVSGTGGSITGITGSFDLGTKTSSATGLDYSGFAATTLAGSGAAATIAGTGGSYTLDNASADQGSGGGMVWSGFGNIDDASGTVHFGTAGSLSGSVNAQTLDYGNYASAVNFSFGGNASGIGGGWSGVTAVQGSAGADTITGMGNTAFNLTGTQAGTAGGIGFSGFEAADTSKVTGAAGFDHASKSSLGMVFASVTDVTGSGAIIGLGGTTFKLGGTKKGRADGIDFNGFDAADAFTVTDAAGFDDAGKTSGGMTFANASQVSGSGGITSVAGSFADDTGTSAASGINYSGFDTVSGTGGSITGILGRFDLGTKISGASNLDYSGFAATTLTGSGAAATIAGTGGSYTLDNATADKGSGGGMAWSGFGNIDDASGTVHFGTAGSLSGSVSAQTLDYGNYASAVNFDVNGNASGIGGGWSGVTAVQGSAGADSITNLGSTAFNLTGTKAGTAGGIGFSGFEAADTSKVTGAAGFDDAAKTSGGMSFANAAQVSGSGGITSVAGSFADDTGTSAASGIVYTDFDAVSGTGSSITGITGRFDLGTKTSSASGLDYSGFAATTLTGSGTAATIAGTGLSYALDNAVADTGSSNGLSWSGFGNIDDASGTVHFGTAGSLSGNVGVHTLDYGSYASAVNFDLADGNGASTGIGGQWSAVQSVLGSGHADTLSGNNQSYTLSGLDAGHSGALGWSSFERIADSGAGTLVATNQHWVLTGHDQGTVGLLTNGFSGIGNLVDTGSGHFTMHAGVDGSLSGGLDAGSGGTLDYTGYTTPVNVNLAGSGSTGIAGQLDGVGSLLADGKLVVGGSSGGPLAITTSGAGNTVTLSGLAVGGDLSVQGADAVLQGGGPLTVAGSTAIHTGGHDITLNHADNDFGGSVTAEGADIVLTDKNDLAIAALSTSANSDLSLIAGGDLTLAAGGIDTGTGDLTLAAKGGVLSTGGALAGNNVALTGNAGLNLGGDVRAANAVTLTSNAGSIKQSAGGITADTLSGYAKGSVQLDGANAIAHLGNFTANGFSLRNAQALAVDGTINGGSGSTRISTTAGDLGIHGAVLGGAVSLAAARNLVLDAALNSGSGSTSLTAGGSISETANGFITAGNLSGHSAGATSLHGNNAIAALGDFSADGFTLVNARSLAVTGTVDGGAAGTTLTTTAGDLSLSGTLGNVAGVTTLQSAGAISQAAGSVIRAARLTGQAAGAAALNGANAIATLGDFSGNGVSLRNTRALTVAGTVSGGDAGVALATTAGDLVVDGRVDGGNGSANLVAAGAINGSGSIRAGTLSGRSGGATTLTGDNHIATLGDFSAQGLSLGNAGALTVAGTVDGGASTTLVTRSGDLRIDGALAGTLTTLHSAGAIVGGAGGSITAATLTGSAVGATTLGTAAQFMDNHVGTLGGFASPAGFSFTNAQTLTLAAVGGSAYSVDAGKASLYLGVRGGDLLQQGTAWTYNGDGTWSSSGRIGTAGAPIYVTGVSTQIVARVGRPPAYFYALDALGNLLPIAGAPNVNVPTSALTSQAQSGNNHGDGYIDPSIINANYRSFGIVPSGILLPADQQDCQPGQPYAPGCPQDD